MLAHYLLLLLLCIISVLWCIVEDWMWVVKARGVDNWKKEWIIDLGRSCHVSLVCGEGRVDQAGSKMSLGTSVAEGCYLGILHERYLWRVHVIGRGPGVEFLHRTKRQYGRCCLAWVAECPIERDISWPLVKMSYSITLTTEMFWELVLRKPYISLVLTMEMGRMYDQLG